MTKIEIGDVVEHTYHGGVWHVCGFEETRGMSFAVCLPIDEIAIRWVENADKAMLLAGSLRLVPDAELTRLIEEARRDRAQDR